ncbi:MAG: NAD-dependent epimerase/dehydratase family protein, partial [Qipengyuania sp.]
VMRMGEYINREVGRQQVKTLIPCNLYGRYDSFDPAKSHLIPAILVKLHQALQEGHEEVEIWGTGEARREFMYAGDCADAIVQAIDRFETLPELMNVGVGSDHTVNEYYETAAGIVGWQGNFVHDTDRPVGMMRKLCSTERQEQWGWSPAHTLEQGLAKTYEFYLGTQEQ